MDSKQTGRFIAKLRKEHQLTQNDLADLLQVTNKAISRWETGEGYPDVSSLVKLASILNVSVDELLTGKSAETIKSSKSKWRFENTSLIIQALISTSIILFVALTYITFNVWIGFLGFAIPSIIGVVWLMVEKNRFINESDYTNEDRDLVHHIERRIKTMQAVVFSIVIVQFYWALAVGDFVGSVMRFDVFLPNAVFVGFITYLGVTFYYSRKSGIVPFVRFFEKWKPGRKAVTLLLFAMLVMTYSQTLTYDTIFLVISSLFWVTSAILLLKHKQPMNFLFASILPVLALNYSDIVTPSSDNPLKFSYLIMIIVIYLFLAIVWIQRRMKNQRDVWYWIHYQTLGLGFLYIMSSTMKNWIGIDAEVTIQYLSIYALVFMMILVPVILDKDQFITK